MCSQRRRALPPKWPLVALRAVLGLAVGIELALIVGRIMSAELLALFAILDFSLAIAITAYLAVRLYLVAQLTGVPMRRLVGLVRAHSLALRIVGSEISFLRYFVALFVPPLGRTHPSGSVTFGYGRGIWPIPIAFTIVIIIESVLVGLVVPWHWLRLLILILSVYGGVVMIGVVSSRNLSPHYLDDGLLIIRFGPKVLARVPLDSIISASNVLHGAYTFPTLSKDTLNVAGPGGTNVLIALRDGVMATVSRRERGEIRFVRLQVDEPGRLIKLLGEQTRRWAADLN